MQAQDIVELMEMKALSALRGGRRDDGIRLLEEALAEAERNAKAGVGPRAAAARTRDRRAAAGRAARLVLRAAGAGATIVFSGSRTPRFARERCPRHEVTAELDDPARAPPEGLPYNGPDLVKPRA